MAADYGQLKDVVSAAGWVMGAGYAITMAWIRRAKWMPPSETVAGGTAKVSALVSSVLTAILFLLRNQLTIGWFSVIAVAALVVAVAAFAVSIYVNTKYSFVRHPPGSSAVRILGGSELTKEAAKIGAKHQMQDQQLYENANYRADLVWTAASLAKIQVLSVLGFMVLLFSGSVALASVAMAFGIGVAS